MRKDDALFKIVQPDESQEPPPGPLPGIGAAKCLFHKGHRRLWVADQDSRLPPRRQLLGSPGIPAVRLAITRRGHAKVDPHDIVRTASVELRLELRTDDVIRWGDKPA